MKKCVLLFILAVISVVAQAQLANFSGRVVGVVDGDTIDVLNSTTMLQYRIRLANIDAPEKNQAFGNRAKQVLSDLIFQKTVIIEVLGMTTEKPPRPPRVLGVIHFDDLNVNAEMVRLGFAWAYRYRGKPSDPTYVEIENDAKAARRGLWFDNTPIEPWSFRR